METDEEEEEDEDDLLLEEGNEKLKNIQFCCEICLKIFKKQNDLFSHKAASHNPQNENLICTHCNKSFPRKLLKMHLESHMGVEKKCLDCTYTTPHSQCMQVHKKKYHSRKFRFRCDTCSKEYEAKHPLKVTEEVDEGFSCKTCGSKFHSEHYLKVHEEIHKARKEKKKKYICGMCEKGFFTRKHLRLHILRHLALKKVYKCTYCDKEVSSTASLKIHMSTHTGQKTLICDICGTGFAREDYMLIHMETHNKKKPFVCHECGESFADKAALSYHMRRPSSHLKGTKFKCPLCSKVASSKELLEKHVAEFHRKGADRLECNICKKTYAGHKYLKAHKQTHELTYDQRAFHCDMCDKKFIQKFRLIGHIKCHLRENEYQCPECKKCLSTAGSLESHMRIHTGETVCTCDVCGKSFFTKRYLRVHKHKKHINHRTYDCKLCYLKFEKKSLLEEHQQTLHNIKTVDTTSEPTTSRQETSKPTTSRQETSKPTTSKQETSKPTTSRQETSKPTTSKQATSKPTTSRQETSKPTTSRQETSKPTTSKPETSKLRTSKRIASKSTTYKPRTSKRKTSMSSNASPTKKRKLRK